MDVRLDAGQTTSDDRRDFLIAAMVNNGEDKNFSVFFRKIEDDLSYDPSEFIRLKCLLRSLSFVCKLCCDPSCFIPRINGDRGWTPPAVLLIHIIARDTKEPGLEFRIILERSQFLIDSDKSLLRQVFRFFDRSNHSVYEIQDLARGQVVNSLKGLNVSFLGLLDPLREQSWLCRFATWVQIIFRQLNSPMNDSSRCRKFRAS